MVIPPNTTNLIDLVVLYGISRICQVSAPSTNHRAVAKMRQIGLVIKTEGNRAWVKMQKGASCGEEHCPLSSSLIDDSQDDFYTVCAINSVGAKSGDQVMVEVEDLFLLRTAFMIYILPILAGILSYALLNYFLKIPSLTYTGTFLSVGIIAILLKRADRKLNFPYRIVELGTASVCISCPLKNRNEQQKLKP